MDDPLNLNKAISNIQRSLNMLHKKLDRLERASNVVERQAELEVPCSPPSGKPYGYGDSGRYAEIETKRREIVRALGVLNDEAPTRETKTLFFAGGRRYCVSVSRRGGKRYRPYTFSYCPEWHEYLLQADQGFFVLGMLDRREAFSVPVTEMSELLPYLSETTKRLPRKWNVTLALQNDDELAIYVPEPIGLIELNPYRFPI